jgi:hypothetical protein
MAFFRYVSVGEYAVVFAATPNRVPNVDRFGRPKVVYFSHDLYATVTDAEAALMIGTLNPTGATAPPAYRLDIDLTGMAYTHHGIAAGGTGSEYTTPDSPLVTAATGIT